MTSDYRLSKEQIRQFHDDGFTGPFTLCEPAEAQALRARVLKETLADSAARPRLAPTRRQYRHLDQRFVYDICARPSFVEPLAQLYGPDLLLWKSAFFNKLPGAKVTPWHQDFREYKYWPLEPYINISAWIALDHVTRDNGCLYAIPGSHRALYRRVPAPPSLGFEPAFDEMTHPEDVDASKTVYWEMKAGQFMVYANIVHGSGTNNTSTIRLGYDVRVTVPIVRIDHDMLFEQHKNLVIRGEDRMGFNKIGTPPAA